MVSGLSLKSLIHFESKYGKYVEPSITNVLLFVYCVRQWSIFIFLHVSVQFCQHHLLRRLSLLHVDPCLLFHRLIDHISEDLFLVSLFYSTVFFYFLPIPYCVIILRL